MPELRVIGPDDWRLWRELRLLALEESPEAFESRLSDWQGPGDRAERWRERLASVPFNVMAVDGGRPVGMASGTPAEAPHPASVELISMYVHPEARASGVASRLVDAVSDWARAQGSAEVVLRVRTSNERAKAFYRRCGFEDVGPADREPGEAPEIVMRRHTISE